MSFESNKLRETWVSCANTRLVARQSVPCVCSLLLQLKHDSPALCLEYLQWRCTVACLQVLHRTCWAPNDVHACARTLESRDRWRNRCAHLRNGVKRDVATVDSWISWSRKISCSFRLAASALWGTRWKWALGSSWLALFLPLQSGSAYSLRPASKARFVRE